MKKLENLTYDVLYQLNYIENKSLREIAKIYKVGKTTILRHSKKLEFKYKTKKLQSLNYEIFYRLYHVENKSLKDIANLYETTTILLRYRIKTLGFEIKNHNNENKLKDLTYEIFYDLYIARNYTLSKIANLYSEDIYNIKKHKRKLKIPNKLFNSRPKLTSLTYEILYQLNIVEGKSLDSIGRLYGVHSGTIHKKAKSLGFKINKTFANNSREVLDSIPFEELYTLYVINKKSVNEICKIYKTAYTVTQKHIEKIGIRLRKNNKDILEDLTCEKLNQLYWVEKKSFSKIAEEYGWGRIKLQTKAIELGIKIRSRSDAAKLAYSKVERKPRKVSLTNAIRGCHKYNEWRKFCFVRDNRTCQQCKRNDNKLQYQVDHIIPLNFIIKKYNLKTFTEAEMCEMLWDTNNGRVLCIECHRQTDTYGRGANKYIETTNTIL